MRKIIFAMASVLAFSACTSRVNFGSMSGPVVKTVTPCNPQVTECSPGTATVNESFTAPSASGKVDIVFIVNTTPTMFLTVQSLASRFAGMLASLSSTDYQVGISNASLNPNTNGNFNVGEMIGLTPNLNLPDPTPFTILNPQNGSDDLLGGNLNFHYTTSPALDEPAMCDQPPYCTQGAAEPMHELMTLIANRSHANNAGFFRPGAFLVPVIISATDENNGSPKVQPADAINAFKQGLGSTMAGMQAYSFLIQPGDTSCLAQYSSDFKMGTGGGYGTVLQQFSQQTGGKSFSICQNAFTSALSGLPSGLSPSVSTVTLGQAPLPGSLSITATPATSLSFTLSGQVVTFSKPLPPGIQLAITYTIAVPQE